MACLVYEWLGARDKNRFAPFRQAEELCNSGDRNVDQPKISDDVRRRRRDLDPVVETQVGPLHQAELNGGSLDPVTRKFAGVTTGITHNKLIMKQLRINRLI